MGDGGIVGRLLGEGLDRLGVELGHVGAEARTGTNHLADDDADEDESDFDEDEREDSLDDDDADEDELSDADDAALKP